MPDVFGPLLDPLVQYGFMRVGLAAAVLVGVTSAVLSCLLVVRHQALLGDAISHSVLLGVAVGYLAAGTAGILWGALAIAVLSSVLITYVERHSPVKLDAVLGIVFTFAFALGLAIISVAQPRGIDVFHILFGNVLGVSNGDLALTAVSGGLVLAVVLVLFRAFHLWSFDPLMARAVGMRVAALDYLFTALLSATIVAALQAVGLILVVAMLITPGATALLLTSRLSRMMLVATGVGVVSAVGGLYGSYYVNVASGPAIVLVASACFALAFLLAPRRGVVAQAFARRRAAKRTVEEDVLKGLVGADEGAPTTSALGMAERLGIDAASLRPRLRALARRGLTEADGDLALTPRGRSEALRIVRTHRLLESYAHDAEGVPLDELHEVADRMEHEVTPEALADIDRILDRPTVDPHGHPIPSAAGELAAILGRPLTEQPDGVAGVVTMVSDDRKDLLQAMLRLGILPRRQLTVLGAQNGSVHVSLDGRTVEVPTEVAARIYVVSA